MQSLARFVYFKVLGWKLEGNFPGHLDKFVIPVVPHTSWLDFFLGLLIREVWNEQINWVGKKSLFIKPFGWFFKAVGGAPIDRSKSGDTVSAIADIFARRARFRLAISPEGTRKKVTQWKTGFYFIAKTANVPVVLVGFDYKNRRITVSEPRFTTENEEADFAGYRAFFEGVGGRHPRD